eukprot:UN32273
MLYIHCIHTSFFLIKWVYSDFTERLIEVPHKFFEDLRKLIIVFDHGWYEYFWVVPEYLKQRVCELGGAQENAYTAQGRQQAQDRASPKGPKSGGGDGVEKKPSEQKFFINDKLEECDDVEQEMYTAWYKQMIILIAFFNTEFFSSYVAVYWLATRAQIGPLPFCPMDKFWAWIHENTCFCHKEKNKEKFAKAHVFVISL